MAAGAGVGHEDAQRDGVIADAVARARNSPFYQRHLAGAYVNGRADLQRLPLTFREDLGKASPRGLLVLPAEKAWRGRESTAADGGVVVNWQDLDEVKSQGRFLREMIPHLSGTTILLDRFPADTPLSLLLAEALRADGGCHVAAGATLAETLGRLRRMGATAIAGFPLDPVLLRELAVSIGLNARQDLGSVRTILCSGGPLPPSLRRVIEKDWDARVIELLGGEETGLTAVGCTAGRLHLCEELVECEVLDPMAHRPVAEGEGGVLTVTTLVNGVRPLVRYFTGDCVQRFRRPCACGRPGSTVRFLGRQEDLIEIEQVTLTPFEILDAAWEFADAVGTRAFLVAVLPRGLCVLAETASGPGMGGEAAEEHLAGRLRVPVRVDYAETSEILDRAVLRRVTVTRASGQICDLRGGGPVPVSLTALLGAEGAAGGGALAHRWSEGLRDMLRRRKLRRQDRAGRGKTD